MNYLAVDYGTKRVGLAYSLNGLIFTLPMVKNDKHLINTLQQLIIEHKIDKIYVGISEGKFALITQKFVNYLRSMIKLPIETVEEAVSTLEAEDIFRDNKKKSKDYQKKIDSIAAAVILNRVIN